VGTHDRDTSGNREVARPEDGDDAQLPCVAHRALPDVHARHAEHRGGHGSGPAGAGGGPVARRARHRASLAVRPRVESFHRPAVSPVERKRTCSPATLTSRSVETATRWLYRPRASGTGVRPAKGRLAWTTQA
jgi:hypothetical protein